MKETLSNKRSFAERAILKALINNKWPQRTMLTEEHFLNLSRRKLFNILLNLSLEKPNGYLREELLAAINLHKKEEMHEMLECFDEIDVHVSKEINDPEPFAKQLGDFLKQSKVEKALNQISEKAKSEEDNFKKIEDIESTIHNIKKIYQDDLFILSQKYIRISPGVDIVDDVMYFCVTFPDMQFLQTQHNNSQVIDTTYLVSSKRDFLKVNKNGIVLGRNLIFKTIPKSFKFEHWKPEFIKSWLYEDFKVDPALLFADIKAIFDKYLDFKEKNISDFLSFWVIGTYFYPIFESYPYVALWGPKASGKTKVLDVAEKLCLNAIHSASITSSALFRTIEQSSCALLIDEAENLRDTKGSKDLLSLLHAGYKRGSVVIRSEGERKFEPKSFIHYSPKMIATITGMQEVLESRCIRITMLKTKNPEKANRNVSESGEDWPFIRHMLYCFALQFFKEIQEIYVIINKTICSEGISGRDAELWSPILAIAKFLDNGNDGVFENLLQFAKKKSQEAKSTGIDDFTNSMLLALKDITFLKEEDIYIKEIKEKQSSYLETDPEKISPKKIGSTIRGLSLAEKCDRTRHGFKYTIRKKTVEDLIERYGI